jgi:putative membrane protein
MARDFVSNDAAEAPRSGDELARMTKQLVHRHIGWLHALTFQLRKPMKWEHHQHRDRWFREHLSSVQAEDNFSS